MQKAKLDKMKEEGKDEHDVKKMGEVNRVYLSSLSTLMTRCCKRR